MSYLLHDPLELSYLRNHKFNVLRILKCISSPKLEKKMFFSSKEGKLSTQLWFRNSQALFLLQKTIASPGRGILAMDESNATCGKRLDSIGLENTEANRQAYRTLLVSAPGLGQYISGAILFEETLYQSTVDGKKIVDVLLEQGIVPGIKVDKVCCTD